MSPQDVHQHNLEPVPDADVPCSMTTHIAIAPGDALRLEDKDQLFGRSHSNGKHILEYRGIQKVKVGAVQGDFEGLMASDVHRSITFARIEQGMGVQQALDAEYPPEANFPGRSRSERGPKARPVGLRTTHLHCSSCDEVVASMEVCVFVCSWDQGCLMFRS